MLGRGLLLPALLLLGSPPHRQATATAGTVHPPPPVCPPGPWHQSGRIDATHPSCGLVGDGVTPGSEALAQCLHLAANCSRTIFFPPGSYWLPETVVLSETNGTEGIRLLGSGSQSTLLCKCANCSSGPSAPGYDQCGPSAAGPEGPRGPVLQVGDPLGKGQTDGVEIEGVRINGVELGLHVVHSGGFTMKRSMVNAERYDYGDMTAAMIVRPHPGPTPPHPTTLLAALRIRPSGCWQITNGFEFYFEEMSFW